MTETTVCDTAFRPIEPDFEVTDRMRERFEERLAEYLLVIAQMWRDKGQDPDSAEGQEALAMVRDTMRVPERPQWMRPLTAVGVFAGPESAMTSPAAHLEWRDAMRTAWSMPDRKWRQVVADAWGVRVETLNHYLPTADVDKEARRQDLIKARTAVYRKYDASGTLLYIGITANFQNRDSVHGVLSPWWKYVDRTDVEWFPNRQAALEAESQAIRDEDPIFNTMHVRRHDRHQRQTDYFNAVRVRA